MAKQVRGIIRGVRAAPQTQAPYIMNVNASSGRYAFDTDDAYTASEAPDDPFIIFQCSPNQWYVHFIVKTDDVLVSQKGWGTLAATGGEAINGGLIELSNLDSGTSLFNINGGFGFLDAGKISVHLICDPPKNP